MENKKRIVLINEVLNTLAGRVEKFYLSGGTALSHFYFRHRLSFDLDFFTQEFSPKSIRKIIEDLREESGKKIELVKEENNPDMAKMMVFMILFSKGLEIRLDFVEDFLKLLKPLNIFNGIPVLSLEDIYLRKIYAVAGARIGLNSIGRKVVSGGREEAKDFYDLYYLSTTSVLLSNFAFQYCDEIRREGLIRWFRTYDRLRMKSGLLELETEKRPDYTVMERHFRTEIEKIVEREVEFI